MPVTKKTIVEKTGTCEGGNDQSVFYRLWRAINLDGPLCPLPDARSAMARQLERMRRQQVHVDEIKRICDVPPYD